MEMYQWLHSTMENNKTIILGFSARLKKSQKPFCRFIHKETKTRGTKTSGFRTAEDETKEKSQIRAFTAIFTQDSDQSNS
jgi:hypothetical protein